MNEVQKEVNAAFELIAKLSVSGDCVEIVAVAKEHLRTAYKLAADKPKEKKDG